MDDGTDLMGDTTQNIEGDIHGQNAQGVGRDQIYIEKLNQQTDILQKIFNTLNYNQQTINVNYGSLSNLAELEDGKAISIRPISNGSMLAFRVVSIVYGFILFIMLPFAIAMQYFYPMEAFLNITSIKYKIANTLEFSLLFFVAYFGFYEIIRVISYFFNKKNLTKNGFDGIEFKQIRRISVDKKLFYQEVFIYTLGRLEPHKYIINQHDYWMIKDLWEAWLHTDVENRLSKASIYNHAEDSLHVFQGGRV